MVAAKVHDRAHWPFKLGAHALLQGASQGEKYTEKGHFYFVASKEKKKKPTSITNNAVQEYEKILFMSVEL